MEGKALLPELMTLQWWPSTEIPSALRMDTLAAAPTAWVSPDTGGASLPATLWFADEERQLPTGIQALGLLRAQLQGRGSLSPLLGKAQSRLWNRILYRRSRTRCSSSSAVWCSQITLLTRTSSFSFLFIRDTGPGPWPGWGPRSST